jgi:hypothetical protein
MSETRYTSGGPDGWLRVRREGSDDVVCLPEYLKVRLSEARNGRDHFTPLEGVHAGARFSVKAGNLTAQRPEYKGPVHLQFSIGRRILSYPGGPITAITVVDNPIPLGMHPVQLPDFPHVSGQGYLGQSAYALTWFYLGHGDAVPGQGDRYLHAGNRSAGCITVDPLMWTSLYRCLVLSRRGDGKTVGTISVVR